MPREYNLYLRDILEAIGRIDRYTRGMGYEEFLQNATFRGYAKNTRRLPGNPPADNRWPKRKRLTLRVIIDNRRPICPLR